MTHWYTKVDMKHSTMSECTHWYYIGTHWYYPSPYRSLLALYIIMHQYWPTAFLFLLFYKCH